MVSGSICYSIWPVFWGYRLMAAKVCMKCSVSYLVHRSSLGKTECSHHKTGCDRVGMWCGSRVGKSPFSRAHFDPVTFTVKLLSSNTVSPKIQIQSKWDSPMYQQSRAVRKGHTLIEVDVVQFWSKELFWMLSKISWASKAVTSTTNKQCCAQLN